MWKSCRISSQKENDSILVRLVVLGMAHCIVKWLLQRRLWLVSFKSQLLWKHRGWRAGTAMNVWTYRDRFQSTAMVCVATAIVLGVAMFFLGFFGGGFGVFFFFFWGGGGSAIAIVLAHISIERDVIAIEVGIPRLFSRTCREAFWVIWRVWPSVYGGVRDRVHRCMLIHCGRVTPKAPKHVVNTDRSTA